MIRYDPMGGKKNIRNPVGITIDQIINVSPTVNSTLSNATSLLTLADSDI
jgi:hypothetical protein